VFEPGSTFKVLTLAIAIEENLIEANELFGCPGFRMIGGERVRCWRTKGHGVQTVAEAVRNSCNCIIMDLAVRIGVDTYYKYLERFGIGRKTGIDFFGESAGLVLPKQYVRPVDLARIGFGQAIATSPIQLVSAFSAIVGDGILRTPRFASKIPQAGTSITSEVRERRVLRPETTRVMRELLFGVVEEGSGKNAAQPGFRIGGKTGTAQKYEGGIIAQGKYISSFISFIEVEGQARYTVFLYVDQPSRQGYYGSITAAPYVGQIWRGMIDHLQIPADPNIVVQPLRRVNVPQVAGQPLFQAVAHLERQGFFVQVEGGGSTAIGTFPVVGTALLRGQPVVIRT